MRYYFRDYCASETRGYSVQTIMRGRAANMGRIFGHFGISMTSFFLYMYIGGSFFVKIFSFFDKIGHYVFGANFEKDWNNISNLFGKCWKSDKFCVKFGRKFWALVYPWVDFMFSSGTSLPTSNLSTPGTGRCKSFDIIQYNLKNSSEIKLIGLKILCSKPQSHAVALFEIQLITAEMGRGHVGYGKQGIAFQDLA